jgi:hypothetical protein
MRKTDYRAALLGLNKRVAIQSAERNKVGVAMSPCLQRPRKRGSAPKIAAAYALAACALGRTTSCLRFPFLRFVHQRTIGAAMKIDE